MSTTRSAISPSDTRSCPAIVVGGGILGLTVALRLAQAGIKVTVLEKAPIAGGLAASFELEPGIWLEKFYHHIFSSDKHIIKLIEQLGLSSQMLWDTPSTGVWYDGKSWQIDSPMALMSFKPLSLIDRFRTGLVLLLLKLMPNPFGLHTSTAHTWLNRAFGNRVYQILWQPLLKQKFGKYSDKIIMAWMWSRIHNRTQKLGYLIGGFQLLYESLVNSIVSAGGEVQTSNEVLSVIKTESGDYKLDTSSPEGGVHSFRTPLVISTLSPFLNQGLSSELFASNSRPKSLAVYCLILEMSEPLIDSYWLNINDADAPFMVWVQHTDFVSPSNYSGRHLAYAAKYCDPTSPMLEWDADQILDHISPLLQQINPEFSRTWIEKAHLFKSFGAQPVVDKNYLANLDRRAKLGHGLYQANMFQIYPHDRGQNYAIELADELSDIILKDLEA